MAEGEISISGALSFAWSLLSHHWRAIWGVLALNALSWTVLFAGMFADRSELAAMGFGALIATKYPLFGSIYRLGSGAPATADKAESAPGALGLQWRPMELRIFAADLLTSVFIYLIAFLVTLALLAPVLGVLMSHGGPPPKLNTVEDLERALGPHGLELITGIQVALWGVMAFLTVRLFLAMPASALRGRVAVLSTWKRTRGLGWRIVLSYILVQAPVWLTFTLITAGIYGDMSSLTPAQILGYSVLSGALAGAASMPLTAALQLFFYNAAEGRAAVVKDNGAGR
jgi:hypothetical protein